MEAVAIQESIIAGRLLSALGSRGVQVQPTDSLSSLIDRFRSNFSGDDATSPSLCERLHEWRKSRNYALHSVCRHIDDPYDASSVEKFEAQLASAAFIGRALVNEVRNAVARLNRKSSK